ncbi:TRAP transporter small permease [Bacillus sp. 1P02SD]|uniref:TRAP transporter small permease n=1 Tax=Bacillus sp. 1P02SD TaxID=3132264 RepID=UPI0039A0A53B
MEFLNKWLNRIDTYLNYISAAAIFVMMLLIVLDVALRAAINKPLVGVLEFTGEYLLVTIVFFGISYAYLHKEHVRVEIIVDRLSKSVQRILQLISNVIGIVVIAALGVTNFQKGLDMFERNIRSVSLLEYPLAPAYMIITVGIAMLIIRLLFETLTILLEMKGSKSH